MNKNLYLHVDGMDLAGKTTVCAKLQETLPGFWEIRTKSLSAGNRIYQLAEEFRLNGRYNREVLGHLYVVALRAELFDFRPPEVNTIQESTVLLRSLAFHTVMGPAEIPRLLLDIAERHPKFDASFVLTADLETRIRRLELRTQEGVIGKHDQLILDAPEKFMKMERYLIYYSKKFFNSIVIDTSNLGVMDVVNLIAESVSL